MDDPLNTGSMLALCREIRQVQILDEIDCHLATATVSSAQESWAVVTNQAPSLQTFSHYGQRFGGIEPHFKDYKSAAFDLPGSRLRTAQALSRLMMLLATATLIALCASIELILQGQLDSIDWHGERGLSFCKLGYGRLSNAALYSGQFQSCGHCLVSVHPRLLLRLFKGWSLIVKLNLEKWPYSSH